jgi:hypothetical protein
VTGPAPLEQFGHGDLPSASVKGYCSPSGPGRQAPQPVSMFPPSLRSRTTLAATGNMVCRWQPVVKGHTTVTPVGARASGGGGAAPQKPASVGVARWSHRGSPRVNHGKCGTWRSGTARGWCRSSPARQGGGCGARARRCLDARFFFWLDGNRLRRVEVCGKYLGRLLLPPML